MEAKMKLEHAKNRRAVAPNFNLVKVVIQELKTTAGVKAMAGSMPTTSTWCSGQCGCDCCCVEAEHD
jgi:hypothetical protein